MIKRYEGVACPVCNQIFNSEDKIVVCPDCGAPYHDECYKKIGKCRFEDKHSENFEFEILKETKEENAPKLNLDTIVCPICHHNNVGSSQQCERCGFNFVGNENPQNVNPFLEGIVSRVSKEEKISDDVTSLDVADYVQVNIPYYIRVFRNIRDLGTSKFNFCSFILSGIWFLYRKQYKIGAIITAVMVLLSVASDLIQRFYVSDLLKGMFQNLGVNSTNDMLASMYNYDTMQNISKQILELPFWNMILVFMPTIIIVVQFIIMLVCGFKANKLYMKNCLKDISAIKQSSEVLSNAQEQIKTKGGINMRIAMSVLLTVFIVDNLSVLLF